MWIKIDENGNIISFASQEQEGFTEVEAPADFNDFFLNWKFYKYIDGQFIRDSEAIQDEASREEKLESIAVLKERLTATNDKVLEGLENLFTTNTITGFIGALISNASTLKDTLLERSAIRAQIAELLRQLGG